MTPSAFMDNAPAFVFSPFPGVLGQVSYFVLEPLIQQTALVSMTTFMKLSRNRITTVSEIPMALVLFIS